MSTKSTTKRFGTLAAIAVLGIAASAASADVISYTLTIDGSKPPGSTPAASQGSAAPGSLNIPLFKLKNTSDSESIVEFSISIGNTLWGFNALNGETMSGGLTSFTRVTPDSLSDGVRADEIKYTGMVGFVPNAMLSFYADIDLDAITPGATNADFRTIMLGTTTPAQLKVKFTNGQVLAMDLTNTDSTKRSFTFGALADADPAPVTTIPVPVPASVYSGMALLAGLATAARIRKNRLA